MVAWGGLEVWPSPDRGNEWRARYSFTRAESREGHNRVLAGWNGFVLRRGRFVFVVKSDGRRSSTGVGVACQAIDFIGFPVDFFDRRLRAQKRARFQPPVPVFGVVCDGRISQIGRAHV